ncbi:unnamed protein product [Symbiodinium pilosum]|uniref:Nuclear pore protein n=1 Tax=Symbiodinium pilosum TaxID=2952 RepID=A0A812XPA8_SYMPI|nr:unnamed protein product [Symbiodinium pilosum]
MTAAVVDVHAEGLRQLERAERLLEVGSTGPRSRRTAVHKSLEQLFGEARLRSQTFSGANAFASTSSLPRLLQTPQAQRLERDIADFTLVPQGTTGALTSAPADADQPSLGLQEFFGLRHERVIVETVEESYRDCLRSCERHSFDRLQADWEDAKSQFLGNLQRLGQGSAVVALCNDGTASGTAAVPPTQDAPIIDALLSESMGPPLVQKIAQLSSASCPAYQVELSECWSILGQELKITLGGITSGALAYLQNRFFDEVKGFVYNQADARLGGVPDAWSLVRAYGRLRFQTSSFPTSPAHVWYAAYVAARAGLVSLLLELPDRASPASERCPMLGAVCSLMARRLQVVYPQAVELAGAGEVDSADLLRADVEQESSGFHDVLVSLLLGRSFAFSRLPEGTVEDWLWYRLHLVHLLGKDEQSPEFQQQFEALRNQAAALPASHFDPGASGVSTAVTAMQTLNSVKVFLLTGQFGRAIQQLQDRSLRPVALHMALVLRKAGTLEAVSALETPLNVSAFLCDYASSFRCSEQLRYFRALDVKERVQALQRLLLSGGAVDELLGYIDPNGRHRPGLLEMTLQEDGMGDQAEFVELCSRAGRQARDQGQYREAIRLLHLGRCYSEVLQVLCRCLRLPIWREESIASGTAQGEAMSLAQDIQRFFDIYERNLDRYALSSAVWTVARKLYATRMFHSLCDRGQPEAALDVFDREQLLSDIDAPSEAADEVWAEYPQIVSAYIRVLNHAAARGAMVGYAMQDRVRRLQSFLAARCNRLVLDQETDAALARLALCF